MIKKIFKVKITKWWLSFYFVAIFLFPLISVRAADTVLTDDFTGTTINTAKWVEIDSVLGGVAGDVQQNGSVSIVNSYDYDYSTYGVSGLYSVDRFASTSLEISVTMTPSSDGQGLGYGDYYITPTSGNAYMIEVYSGGLVYAYAIENGNYRDYTECGTVTLGATYKMKVIVGGFEVYKNSVLICTLSTSLQISDKPIFLEAYNITSIFDDVLVFGNLTASTTPSSPIIVTATAADAEVSVSFSPPVSSGGSEITSYTVTSSPGGIVASGTSSPIIVSGLENGTAYTFSVTATNAMGASAASNASNAVTPTFANQVRNLVVTGVYKQALLSWQAPISGAVSDYVIEYKKNVDGGWSIFNDGVATTTKTIVAGLENNVLYKFRVSAVISGATGTPSVVTNSTPVPISKLVFVFTGESNSGGIGLNSEATVGELAVRSSVQIENLTSGLFQFESLDIGVNNLRDHYIFDSYYDNRHGFELQLANRVEEGVFPDNSQVYLIKTGQGASTVGQWNVGGTYWNKFLQRTAAAKTQLPTQKQWVVWMSLGINDASYHVATSTWKIKMKDHLDKIKADLPGAIIIMTQFQGMVSFDMSPYDKVLGELAESESNVFVVNTASTSLIDAGHWSYAGLKTVTDRMITITKDNLGLNYTPTPPVIVPAVQSGGGGGGILFMPTMPIQIVVTQEVKVGIKKEEAKSTTTAEIVKTSQPKDVKDKKINKNLKKGSEGADVIYLQQILSDQYSELYPKKLVTGYFGQLTYQAVKDLQCKVLYICDGDEKTTGWGAVGPRTREVLK